MKFYFDSRATFKSRIMIFLLLVSVLTVVLTVQPVLGLTWTLNGHVRDEAGTPVSDVSIIAQDIMTLDEVAEAFSEADGFYSMMVPTGTYNLIVTPPIQSGLAPTTISEVPVTTDTLVDIYLVPSEVISFSGYILDRHGDPIPYQAVQLYQWESGLYYSASTAEDGLFTMNILPGDYELQLSGGDGAGIYPGGHHHDIHSPRALS
jgi:hypothetical protein